MFGGLSRFNENHPGFLMGAGNLISGKDVNPAILYAMGVKKERSAKAEKLGERNKTKQWLMRNRGMSEEDADAIISSGAVGNYMKPPKDPSETDYSQVPVYMTDPETGKTVLGVMGDDGTMKRVDTGGMDVASGLQEVDTGTEILLYDKRTGQYVGSKPKQNYDAAYETNRGAKEGAAAGEASASYKSITSKMPGLEQVISELDQLANDATYTLAGQGVDWLNRQAGIAPRDSAVARREYISKIQNQILPLLRDTFGAQFTQKEGETLMATLGDPDLSPQEKQAILKSFIEQKRRDVEALGVQVGAPQTRGSAPAGGAQPGRRTSSGVLWSVEP